MVLAPAGQGVEEIKKIVVNVNAVEVTFTVKDSKGHLVPGLMPRDIQVYENGEPQAIRRFTGDAFPMSVAIVIDQSMTQDEMDKVNNALGALQDAFTKYDEITVFTYNKSPKMITDFTGAQSARLTQAVERSKGTGRQPPMAGSYGPLGQTTVINDQNVDPNTAAVRGHTGMALETEREVHPLNDAILAAANALSTRPIERRRVIYVISDGKEFGSKAKMSQVVKILQTNNIEVDGTLVGDSAVWGLGTLDRMHLPLMMRDNVLTPYAIATGGNVDSEFRTAEIEKSFDKIAGEARYRYTLVYYSREPFVDGKYRKLEVKVLHPDLLVLAKPGYWPSAMEVRQRQAVPAAP
jgi:VWFA-related protein